MIGTLRHEPGKGFILDGYPEGSTVHGLALPEGQDLCRLLILYSEMRQVMSWLETAINASLDGGIREGMAVAAWVRFCGCFESTAGLRAQPLQPKKIYTKADRPLIEIFRQIRNKVVAHDEQLFPSNSPLVVLNADGLAIEALAMRASYPLHCRDQLGEMARLAKIASEWLEAEADRVGAEIVAKINGLPFTLRQMQRDSAVPFEITFVGKQWP